MHDWVKKLLNAKARRVKDAKVNSGLISLCSRCPLWFVFSYSTIWLITLLLANVLSLAAQEETRYSIPDEAQVTVSVDSPTLLILNNETPGAVVTITAEAVDNTQIDPVLWITDSASRLLAYNHNTLTDDGLVDVSARIVNLILPTVGLYSIYVDSFNGVQTGDITVTIRESNLFDVHIEARDKMEIITFSLPEDSVFSYAVTVSSGDILTITAFDGNGQLDPYLRIVDSSGNIVASNDDHNSHDLTLNTFAARIAEWHIPADDTYVIEVLDFLGRAGAMALEIREQR